jgi:hypothetical protein
MSAGARVNYEVQTYDNGRWAISEVVPSEDSARRKAETLLAQKHIVGVRIVKESHFASDNRREAEIFKRMKENDQGDDFTIAVIEEAPVCERVTDYYKTAARNTMARLFMKYLEKFELTPLEMLHHHASLKRLVNLDTLVPSAVDKVAGLQARSTGEDTRRRREALFNAVDALVKRAREAEGKQIPDLKASTLDDVLASLDAKVADEDERRFLANVALARTTINWQNLLAKVTNLLPMASSQRDARSLAMIDEMMADILVARPIVKDIIGTSKHMGDALMRLLDLIEGKCKPAQYAAAEVLALLNALFTEDKLPRAKAVLYERIERDLKGPVRLTNVEQIAADKEFFTTILQRVATEHGVLGGRPVAGGLAERWARLNNIGGLTGRRKAIEGVCGLLATGKLKFVYLLALYDSTAEAEVRGSIESQIRALVQQLNTIQKIAPAARTEKTRLQEVAAIQRLVLDSMLEERFKKPIADVFDQIVAEYLVAENVIQRLDDDRLSFRDRATRLVAFCASGVLTVGRATTIARDRIVTYLRRKDFISEFTADIPDAAAKEKAIKDFYALLARTGFDMRAAT